MRDVLKTRARYRVSIELGLKDLGRPCHASGKATIIHGKGEEKPRHYPAAKNTPNAKMANRRKDSCKGEHEGCHGIRALSATRVRRNNTPNRAMLARKNIRVRP
jgi:hypothetical protein